MTESCVLFITWCNLICTQPRRISATSVATRVAQERGEKIGTSVGYKIRLESVHSSSTKILFVTTGVLLRRLAEDPLLAGVRFFTFMSSRTGN